jgi:MFS superfamily sulfate permease-like transporter
LITGIIGGLVVGVLSGSPLLVSGPAAGMTVLVWELVSTHGIGMLGPIVLLAGLIQAAAGLLGLGQWFRAVSPAVVHGMLAGIGILIVASQVHVAIDDKPHGSGLHNLLAIPQSLWKALMPLADTFHHVAALVGLLTLAILVGWQFVPPKLKLVPAPLVAVVAATAVTAWLKLPIQTVSVPASLMEAISWPSLDALGKLIEGSALGTAVAIAIIASAETLLSATAVDGMHTGARTRYNRELIAQGIGNSLCGLLGALPMTGVIVRSSVNVNAGAKTRLSTIFHGLWILLFVAALPALLRWIPTSALAAMLVYTGFKLVDLKALRQLGAYGRTEIGIYLATVLGIIATNLLEGVLIGVGLAIVKLLFTFSHLEARVKVEDDGRRATLSLKGAASFVRLPQLAEALERVPVGAELHVKLDQLDFIDHACFELLESWEKQHHASGGRVVLEWEALHDLIRQHRPSTLREPV